MQGSSAPQNLKRDAEELYKKNNLPEEYYSRLHFIDNKVNIPDAFSKNKSQLWK